MLPTQTTALVPARLALGMSRAEEIARSAGWQHWKQIQAGMPALPGVGLWVESPLSDPVVLRTPHAAQPKTIERIAEAVRSRRPRLDEVSRLAAAPILGESGGESTREPEPSRGGGDSVSRLTLSDSPLVGRLTTDMERAAERTRSATQRLAEALRVERLKSMPDEYVESEFARLADQAEDERATGGVVVDEPDDRTVMRLLLAEHGPVSGSRLRELLGGRGRVVPAATLYRWLQADAVKLSHGQWQLRDGGDR